MLRHAAPKAPSARTIAAIRAQANGQRAEDALSGIHEHYRRLGYVVRWTGPRMKQLGKGRAVPVEEGPPDIVAQAKGWAYWCDVKSTVGDRWALDLLKEHQARDLDALDKQGAITGLLLCLAGRWWWIPWPALSARWWRNHARITLKRPVAGEPASLDDVAVRLIGRELGPDRDWLSVAGAMHMHPTLSR